MTKPTKEELSVRAWGIAESHFFSDDECEVPWQPFEHFDDNELQGHVSALAGAIFFALSWAQGEDE